MLWLFAMLSAQADTFTLDNDATINGVLASYAMGGSCQISVQDGDLAGTLIILPCDRIVRFEQQSVTPMPQPAPSELTADAPPLETEEVEEPAAIVALSEPTDAPHANDIVPTETAAHSDASASDGLWATAEPSTSEADTAPRTTAVSAPNNLRVFRYPTDAKGSTNTVR